MGDSTNVFECGNCGAEVTGYTKSELHDLGWRFHALPGARSFPMCTECEAEFAQRREVADAVAS